MKMKISNEKQCEKKRNINENVVIMINNNEKWKWP